MWCGVVATLAEGTAYSVLTACSFVRRERGKLPALVLTTM